MGTSIVEPARNMRFRTYLAMNSCFVWYFRCANSFNLGKPKLRWKAVGPPGAWNATRSTLHPCAMVHCAHGALEPFCDPLPVHSENPMSVWKSQSRTIWICVNLNIYIYILYMTFKKIYLDLYKSPNVKYQNAILSADIIISWFSPNART